MDPELETALGVLASQRDRVVGLKADVVTYTAQVAEAQQRLGSTEVNLQSAQTDYDNQFAVVVGHLRRVYGTDRG